MSFLILKIALLLCSFMTTAALEDHEEYDDATEQEDDFFEYHDHEKDDYPTTEEDGLTKELHEDDDNRDTLYPPRISLIEELQAIGPTSDNDELVRGSAEVDNVGLGHLVWDAAFAREDEEKESDVLQVVEMPFHGPFEAHEHTDDPLETKISKRREIIVDNYLIQRLDGNDDGEKCSVWDEADAFNWKQSGIDHSLAKLLIHLVVGGPKFRQLTWEDQELLGILWKQVRKLVTSVEETEERRNRRRKVILLIFSVLKKDLLHWQLSCPSLEDLRVFERLGIKSDEIREVLQSQDEGMDEDP